MRPLSGIPGMLTVELTSADPEAALGNFVSSGIVVSSIQKTSDLVFLCQVSQKDYPLLFSICQKEGYSLKIRRHTGSYWVIRRMLLRPFLVLGVLFFFLAAALLPTRVLFIQVEGNTQVPTNKILTSAQNCGISFFSSRRAVRSEKVKNALLYCLPELEWVGVNTAGCVATISVRERVPEQNTPKERCVSSIVADRDGFVLSVTAANGNPLCQPGQYVTAGQILVSGYTDCGIYIQATSADAEILAQTSRDLEAIRLAKPMVREKKTGSQRKYNLLVGKKRINLWKGSGIWDTTCGRIYEEKCATLPGGFQLPLALCIEEYTFYDTHPVSDASTAETSLSSFAETYLCQQMTAGTILSREEVFSSTEEAVRMTGVYTCQEMIGKVKQEQIGE